ncbi:uncharacterized protein LOC122043552 [Zingiber officinale]|uniref:uncharacterized protein LOC122043552 n=1 Tax=Zingiber officinale TaxID=94328 RepID=UPI001C4BEBF1|nr:uncharacterized protein LOC122043552 [Zingiber officinale]
MPYYPYRCKKCHKRFSTKQALGGHQNGHNYEKKLMMSTFPHRATSTIPENFSVINSIHKPTASINAMNHSVVWSLRDHQNHYQEALEEDHRPHHFRFVSPVQEVARKDDEKVKVATINFLDADLSQKDWMCANDMDRDYDKANLDVGLDLSLHL